MKLVDRRLVIPTRAIRESSASTACEVRNKDAGLPTQTLANDEIADGGDIDFAASILLLFTVIISQYYLEFHQHMAEIFYFL